MTRRRLDTELVRRKLASSRTEAQRAIAAGRVRVGSNPEPKASTLVAPEDAVHVTAEPEEYVSRAGHKLAAGLDAFGIDVVGLRAIDIGASTGGFTDCLLQRGIDAVVALDVGYGQMHWRIRQDRRVQVVERTNIRTTDIAALEPPFDVVVADLSFISLRAVADQIVQLGSSDTSWVLLIKPQFEAGKDAVGKGGIVRDPVIRRRTVEEVFAVFGERGAHPHGLITSPITGAGGNIEYVAWFRTGTAPTDPRNLLDGIENQSE